MRTNILRVNKTDTDRERKIEIDLGIMTERFERLPQSDRLRQRQQETGRERGQGNRVKPWPHGVFAFAFVRPD